MSRRNIDGGIIIALCIALTATSAFALKTKTPTGHGKSPGWFLQGSAPKADLARATLSSRAADPRTRSRPAPMNS